MAKRLGVLFLVVVLVLTLTVACGKTAKGSASDGVVGVLMPTKDLQ